MTSLICPFRSNKLSHPYGLEGTIISSYRAVGGVFQLYLNWNRTVCKQTLQSLIQRHKMGVRLGSVLFVLSNIMDARLIWFFLFSLIVMQRHTYS